MVAIGNIGENVLLGSVQAGMSPSEAVRGIEKWRLNWSKLTRTKSL